MKSMNRRENRKIAVMAAVIVGFMVFAFMPLASAIITSFSVTPSTGIAGAVDSYDVLVTTGGVTSIDITIPAGFIAVAPMSGGVEIARVDFWNSSTKNYYGHATITSNDTNPTGQVDIYCKFGGDEATSTQYVDYYTAGKKNKFTSGFPSDTSEATIVLPTKTADGSIEIAIDCVAFQLEDVHIALKQFVRNPAAGDYDFLADGTMETVTIKEPLVYPAVYKDDLWFVDSDGNLIADICFLYGGSAPIIPKLRIPLVGDLFGYADSLIIYDSGYWSVDTNQDGQTDYCFKCGGPATPLVGDVDQDGKDDIVAFNKGVWYVKYGKYLDTIGLPDCVDVFEWDDFFLYGDDNSIPLIGDVDRNGKDDIVVVAGSAWYIDTDHNQVPNYAFLYGAPGTTPLVGDLYQDGYDEVVIFSNGLWFVDADKTQTPNFVFLYGTADMIPLVGEI